MAIPVLTVARPRDRCCARGRLDAQVGARPRGILPFPQSTLASPSHPSPRFPPGLRGELRVGECRPPGKPAVCNGSQRTSGAARVRAQLAVCGPPSSIRLGRDPGKRGRVRWPAAGQRRSSREPVPLAFDPQQALAGDPKRLHGRSDETILFFLVFSPPPPI